MTISFSSLLDGGEVTFFLLAEVLYHCAAQVRWRSMTLIQHCSNIFHLRGKSDAFCCELPVLGSIRGCPLQSIWLPDSGCLSGNEARAQLHNDSNRRKPGSNLPKVPPRKSPCFKPPLFHTIRVLLCFNIQSQNMSWILSFFYLFFPPHFRMASLLLPYLYYGSDFCGIIRSPADNLQQPGVH